MRQLWISVAILAGMVLLLSWNMVHVHQLTEPMREDLSQAVAAAREEDWQKAEALTQRHRSIGRVMCHIFGLYSFMRRLMRLLYC